mgnify:CR=1 FL=1
MGVDAVMAIKVPTPVSDADLATWNYKVLDVFGPEPFFLYEPDMVPLSRVTETEYYGLSGGTVITVNLTTRYYGPGYERGNFPLVYALGAFLERVVPGSVWYGGDSDDCLRPFGDFARTLLLLHAAKNGRRPYVSHFDRDEPRDSKPSCARCGQVMTRCGWGMDYARFSCACGDEVVARGGDRTYSTDYGRRSAKRAIERRALKDLFEKDPAAQAEYHRVTW